MNPSQETDHGRVVRSISCHLLWAWHSDRCPLSSSSSAAADSGGSWMNSRSHLSCTLPSCHPFLIPLPSSPPAPPHPPSELPRSFPILHFRLTFHLQHLCPPTFQLLQQSTGERERERPGNPRDTLRKKGKKNTNPLGFRGIEQLLIRSQPGKEVRPVSEREAKSLRNHVSESQRVSQVS